MTARSRARWTAWLLAALAVLAAGCSGRDASVAGAETDDAAATAVAATNDDDTTVDEGSSAADQPAAEDAAAPSGGAVADAVAASCPAFPTYSEGPYYLHDATPRADVREGVEGAPLTMRVVLLDSATCDRLSNQTVDLWGADPNGSYSGVVDPFTGLGDAVDQRWLRGQQTTDENGVVEFTTIFPGWTPGDPPHVTLTTPIDDTQSFTWRLVFDDDVAAQVYTDAAYADRGEHPVRADQAAEDGSVIAPVTTAEGLFIEVAVAIDMEQLRQPPVSATSSAAVGIAEQTEPVFVPDLDQLPGEIQAMFLEAAQALELDENVLYDQFRDVTPGSPPDVDAIADVLGVSPEALAEALPLLAGGAPTG